MERKTSPDFWTRDRIRYHARALSQVVTGADRSHAESPSDQDKEPREALSPFWAWRQLRR